VSLQDSQTLNENGAQACHCCNRYFYIFLIFLYTFYLVDIIILDFHIVQKITTKFVVMF